MNLKKVDLQVMVITGATSGIGLVTARMAARQGVRLVLAARNEEALKELTSEIIANGGQAFPVVADVGREEDVTRIADAARTRFGAFDTWVNNAGVSIYGRILDVKTEDMHHLFDTNFWGVVYGSRAAAEKLRNRGGAIINIGSVLSENAMPLQGMYSASKHAVKAFTDALRMEVEKDGLPISVSLIKPGAINTPYTEHAKNYMEREPQNPPPIYAPELVAEAILHCAENRTAEVTIGGAGKLIAASGKFSTRFRDKFMEAFMFDMQKSDRPSSHRPDGFYRSASDLSERSLYPKSTRETSLYTKASLHPLLSTSMALGAGLAVAALMRERKGSVK